ncbi:MULTISPECIES: MFS transporter [Nocardiopsis]|uniref:Putative proline/betaine transporter n=1 Tax=Nocardiopsis dassonvillei (strain ATCC 23218 / DSM 43111 / CIP 107115 / JCM 7437 / KCTC 9190 / NBRC 14626 / NCTC 10488 / NRRL B-5397 / IMRU 509) TaxID=446468 RepID=D7AZT9_NOCDD|nr:MULTISPECIES: MFS transporter [Nocardiopsis]ADH68210.1 metabolite/H+ symporter, major facilitator superfamily (MFS) [Nocardiopsis dassonvillei subsp. dassonvillei DSM 43111]NKY78303.1 MHS family MFS transporter [Nocardiopsis dassonvillei]VEI88713.1 Inner membrane metabolite transport protein yhjE [Nocardiopsis dassonvillei]
MRQKASFGRVVTASLIGTTIEWYDFFLYGSAAALVFNHVFFPESDPLVGTMLAFTTYAVGFVARPLGGLVFGHFGDRIGRKQLLVISLLLMGGSTFAIGLLPTYAVIGVAAPLLLTLLRVVQGFALGGEWGGAVLLVAEHGEPRHRGFWASWPQAGAPGGNLLATAVLAVLAVVMSDAAFLSWGWRVPFLLSGVLVLIGLWVRLAVSESRVFRDAHERAAASARPERAPILGVLRDHWREALVAMGVRMAENVSYYVVTAFILVYATQEAGMPNGQVLNAVLVASAVHLVTIPAWGALSDRIGRRPVTALGAAGAGLWVFAFFPLVDAGTFWSVTLAVTVGLVLHGAMYGPQAAFFSELFSTRVRYSGASVGYQLASIVAGGLAPLVATALLASFGSSVPVSLYVAAMAAVTLVAVAAARETRGRDLREVAVSERSG